MYSILTITVAALVDSINPCAVTVLIILLATLIKTEKSNKALFVGLSFSFGLFMAYFLLGLGLFSFLRLEFLASFLHLIIGLLAILIGVFYIKNYLQKKKKCKVCEDETRLRVPSSLRLFFKKITQSATRPLGAFLFGFFITFFELPCTGGPYFFALGFLSHRPEKLSLIPILIHYNLIFILPIVLLTLLIYFGFTTAEQTRKWKERNIARLKLAAGIVMIILGLLVILV